MALGSQSVLWNVETTHVPADTLMCAADAVMFTGCFKWKHWEGDMINPGFSPQDT